MDWGAWHGSRTALGEMNTADLLTLDDLVRLVLDWNRPVKLFIETKHPVRIRGPGGEQGSGVVAPLRDRIAASADLSRAVVMSFSAAAVAHPRAAPLLPTVLLGETSRYLGGGAQPRSARPRWVRRCDAARASRTRGQGRGAGPRLYCWTVDHYDDIRFCRDLGVAWIATNYPGRTKEWLQSGLAEQDSTDGGPTSRLGVENGPRDCRIGTQCLEELS